MNCQNSMYPSSLNCSVTVSSYNDKCKKCHLWSINSRIEQGENFRNGSGAPTNVEQWRVLQSQQQQGNKYSVQINFAKWVLWTTLCNWYQTGIFTDISLNFPVSWCQSLNISKSNFRSIHMSKTSCSNSYVVVFTDQKSRLHRQ